MISKKLEGLNYFLKQELEAQRTASELCIPAGDVNVFSYTDENVLFSLTKGQKEELKSFPIVIITHMLMVANPLPGMEYTREKNKRDIIQKWVVPAMKLPYREKRHLTDVMPLLSTEDEEAIKDILENDHEYKEVLAPEGYIQQLQGHFLAVFNNYPYRKALSKECYKELYPMVDRVIALIRADHRQRHVKVR